MLGLLFLKLKMLSRLQTPSHWRSCAISWYCT